MAGFRRILLASASCLFLLLATASGLAQDPPAGLQDPLGPDRSVIGNWHLCSSGGYWQVLLAPDGRYLAVSISPQFGVEGVNWEGFWKYQDGVITVRERRQGSRDVPGSYSVYALSIDRDTGDFSGSYLLQRPWRSRGRR